jgi:hypothetical protein
LAVGLTEEGAEDGEGGGVAEDGAERDGGRLDGWEVWCWCQFGGAFDGYTEVLLRV